MSFTLQQLASGQTPATGRGPVFPRPLPAGFAPLVVPTQAVRFEPMLAQAPRPHSTLPEAPLRSQTIEGADTAIEALAALTYLRGARAAFEALQLARKAAIYSGHPGADVPFWALYARSRRVESIVADAQNAVLGQEVPSDSPVKEDSLVRRVFLGFPNQDALDRAFLFGLSADTNRVLSRIQQLREQSIKPPRVGRADPQAFAQLALSIEQGFEARGLLDEQTAIALERSEALLEFVRQMNLFGAFSGRASSGAMPGERGDP